ncbi:MAG TPA: hypothetical protein VNN22_07995 [Verrucomicrobiae bacterium]|nr:hypothetical protein [Verrucomicrobiae bacterium]
MITLENRPITFDVRVRYYGGAYIARCNGCIASSTNCAAVAAKNAANKHAAKIPIPQSWQISVDELLHSETVQVTYTPPLK